MKTIDRLSIVDDDDAFVFLTKEIIADTNLVKDISVFRNGKQALDFLETHKSDEQELPQIMLLDLSMPVMDGWQFLDEYKRLSPSMAKPIIIYICTSSISPDDVIRARAMSSVSDFMVKPVTHDNLISMIKNMNWNSGPLE